MPIKKAELVELVKEVVAETMEAVYEVYEEEIAPLVDFGSPAKVIGAPYEKWTPEQLQEALAIFGPKLEGYIANKEVDSLLKLESEEV